MFDGIGLECRFMYDKLNECCNVGGTVTIEEIGCRRVTEEKKSSHFLLNLRSRFLRNVRGEIILKPFECGLKHFVDSHLKISHI